MSQQTQTDNTSSTSEQIVKSDSTSEIELLTQIAKSQSEQITAIKKDSDEKFDAIRKSLEELKKQEDANPVDHGASKEEKPKVSDDNDVGGDVKDEPSYAPDGDAQASIRAPADEAPKTDTVKVSKSEDMDKKSEDMDDKEKKSEEKEDADMKKSDNGLTDMRKSVAPDGYEYEMVKAVRPKYDLLPSTPEQAPTGYQVMKSMFNGWGGKHQDFEKSFIEGYERLLKGEFGTGGF